MGVVVETSYGKFLVHMRQYVGYCLTGDGATALAILRNLLLTRTIRFFEHKPNDAFLLKQCFMIADFRGSGTQSPS